MRQEQRFAFRSWDLQSLRILLKDHALRHSLEAHRQFCDFLSHESARLTDVYSPPRYQTTWYVGGLFGWRSATPEFAAWQKALSNYITDIKANHQQAQQSKTAKNREHRARQRQKRRERRAAQYPVYGTGMPAPHYQTQEALPVTEEKKLTTQTAGTQAHPSISAFTDGSLVTAYSSQSDGGSSGIDVYFVILDANMNQTAGPFRANQVTARNQANCKVKALSNGNVAMVWNSDQANNGTHSVYLRIFQKDGTPITNDILVEDIADNPDIDQLADGNIVVVSSCDSGGHIDMCARVFDIDGQVVSTPFVVNSVAAGTQLRGRVTALPTGSQFEVAWEHLENKQIERQRCQLNANAIERVGSQPASFSGTDPDVVYLDDGGYVVTALDASNNVVITCFNANDTQRWTDTITGIAYFPSATSVVNDKVVAVWVQKLGPGDYQINQQVYFAANGVKDGAAAAVNQQPVAVIAAEPRVVRTSNGFVVAYVDGDVFGRAYTDAGSNSGTGSVTGTYSATGTGTMSLTGTGGNVTSTGTGTFYTPTGSLTGTWTDTGTGMGTGTGTGPMLPSPPTDTSSELPLDPAVFYSLVAAGSLAVATLFGVCLWRRCKNKPSRQIEGDEGKASVQLRSSRSPRVFTTGTADDESDSEGLDFQPGALAVTGEGEGLLDITINS